MPKQPSEENIKKQLKEEPDFNSKKNLLVDDQIKSLKRIEVTGSLVEQIQHMDAETEQEMIDFLTDEALQEFCRVNQYFSFNSESVTDLKAIYGELNQEIRRLDKKAGQEELDNISQHHYSNLCDWLVRTNAFAGKMYSGD